MDDHVVLIKWKICIADWVYYHLIKGEYYIGQEMADFLSKLHFVPVSQDCPAKKSQDTGFCNMVPPPATCTSFGFEN
jgi:hypothetical protein